MKLRCISVSQHKTSIVMNSDWLERGLLNEHNILIELIIMSIKIH